MLINYTDIAAALILLYFIYKKRRRGIAYFAVSTIGKIISMIIAVNVSGAVTSALRVTPVFDVIKEYLSPIVSVESALDAAGVSRHILANDNSEIYKLFRVDTFNDYLASYAANIVLNILVMASIYFLIAFLTKAFFGAKNVIVGLPGIKGINGILGILSGVIEGVIVLWLIVLALVFFALQGKALEIYEMLLTSQFAINFLKYNVFVNALFNISA